MKANQLRWILLFLLVSAVFQLPAQQSEADRKLLSDVRTKAEKGDARSQYELGRAFARGSLGVAKDDVEAMKWYRKAAEQNYAQAQYDLGLMYAFGQGVTQDHAEAVNLYRMAAKGGFADAQYELARCYALGIGVKEDKEEAFRWTYKSASQGFANAEVAVALYYAEGRAVKKDEAEAVKWLRKAAEQHLAMAQYLLGRCYGTGAGVTKDDVEAVRWFRKAAAQDLPEAECSLGGCYYSGHGVAKDYREAARWYRKAADQNYAQAQYNLGNLYLGGEGLTKDYVEAYKWWNLASAQGDESAKHNLSVIEKRMTPEQIAEGQKLARNFKPREVPSAGGDSSAASIAQARPESSGTGFFITEDGYLITNQHVAGNGAQVRLVTEAGLISANVVKVDAANDLALLKVEGKFEPLPVVSSRVVKLGSTVATVGFPNIGLQGFAPKLAKGEIAALSGAQDDPRYFQISVPVQPGNSGGALVDEHGNVVGVVSAKLNVAAAVATSGALPENVNYAVKSSFLLSFLESVPEVAAKLKEPNTKDRKFEDVVKSAEQAAVLVLVY